jgi:peptide/nickel transport system substrate-binding protein
VPVIERFIVRVLPDDAAATQALIAGEIDIFNSVPGPQIAAVEATPGLTVISYPTLSFNYYTLNLDPTKSRLFEQREVRQALLLALDREAIIATVYGGFGLVPVGTQSPLSQAYAPDQIHTRYPFDPDRARQLLAAAGWTDADGDGVVERNGTPLAFEMIFPDGAESELVAAYFQEAWVEIGVRMTPRLMPFEAMIAEDGPLLTHDFEAIQIGLTGSPDGGQGFLFACDAYDAGFNVARYCSEAYDEIEERQLRELDPARRRELLVQQQNIANDDLPISIFRLAVSRVGASDRLRNFYPNDYAFLWSLPRVWVAPA